MMILGGEVALRDHRQRAGIIGGSVALSRKMSLRCKKQRVLFHAALHNGYRCNSLLARKCLYGRGTGLFHGWIL